MTPEETAESMRKMTEAMELLTGTIRGETEEMKMQRIIREQIAARKKELNEAGITAGKAALAALGGFSKALMSTEAGMSKYNSAIGGAGNAALDLGKHFGIAGLALGGLAKAITMGMEAVNKQNDAMLKAYDTLSEFGMAAKLTTTDILKIGQASGYTSHNLEIFTKNAIRISIELAALTGSASAGTEAFGKLTKLTQEQRNQYNRLGQSQEKVTQLQTDWVKITVMGGQSLTKNTDQMQKSSLRYIDSMNELAALTGISVEKQQEAQKIAMQNENFNAYISEQDQKRQRLEDEASKMAAGADKDALLAKADEISKMVESKKEYATWIAATASASTAAAHLEAISTNTGVVWTESNVSLKMAGVDMERLNAKMMKGEDARIDGMAERNKATQRHTAAYGELTYKFGDASREFNKIMGQDNLERENQAKFNNLKTQKDIDDYTASFELQKKELEFKRLGLGMVDIIKKTQNDQLTAELRARQALDALTSTISGPVNAAFRGLLSVMNSFGKAVGKVISWIPFFGDTGKKIMDQFRDPEEIKDKINKNQKEKEALEAQIKQDEDLNKEKVADYKAAQVREKESKDNLKQVEANILLIREKQAKATTDDEKKRLLLELGTANVDKFNADKDYKEKQQATRSAAIQNPVAAKIVAAKTRIKEIEGETTEDKAALRRLSGEPEEAAKEKTVDNDPAVREARQALINKENLLIDKKNKAQQELFEQENEGEKYSAEAFHKKYDTQRKQVEFAKKIEDIIKTDVDAIAALKLSNTALEKSTQEKLEKLLIADAKKADEDYEKKHGVMPGTAKPAGAKPPGGKPVAPAAVGSGKENLATNVAAHESGSAGYNAYNKGTVNGKIVGSDKDVDFSKMSISEFLRRGDLKAGDPDKLFAVGKYQIIPKTMRELVNSLKLDPAKTMLDEKTQDLLFTQGLTNTKRPLVDAYIKGKSDDLDGALMELAQEFASIGVPYPAGKANKRGDSYYGDGNVATNPPESVANALKADRAKNSTPATAQASPANPAVPSTTAQASPVPESRGARSGGVFSGPTTGYGVELHGTEMVMPLDDAVTKSSLPAPGDFAKAANDYAAANSPTASSSTVSANNTPTESPATGDSIRATYEMMNMMAMKLDTMIDKLSTGNDTQSEILMYSRA